MIFTALITLIFSLRHYSRHRAFRIIPYYLGCFFLQTILDFNRYLSPRDRAAISLDLIGNTAFTIFEFCVFSLLILRYIEGYGRRLAIKVNAVLFFIAAFFLYLHAFPKIPIYSLGQLELIALVPPCVIYFFELFTTVNTKALKDRPSFWIVTGIAYMDVCSFTLNLSFEYLGRFGDGAYALGSLLYCILFVLIMRAYKCSPAEWVTAGISPKDIY